MADIILLAKVRSIFSAAADRVNLVSGEDLEVSLGKISKWLTDLKPVAFSGSYNDLANKPTNLQCDYNTNNGVKNLLQITTETDTINNVTFTVDKVNGTVTANGTASALTIFYLEGQSHYLDSGDYILSLSPDNISNVFLGMYLDTMSGSWYARSDNNGGKFSIPASYTATKVGIRVASGTTLNNVVFKPMIRSATIEDDAFVSYAEPNYKLTQKTEQALDYGGYNLLPLENITADSGIVYTVDKNAGTITVTSKGSSSMPQITTPIPSELVGNYYFAVVGSSSSADAYVWCTNDSARAKKWDGTTNSAADVGGGNCEIKLVSGKSYILQIRLRSAISGSLVFKPMVYSDKLKGIPFQPYAMSNLELTQKKVSISGDTITGSYNFKSTNIDRAQNPESTTTADTNIKFTDTNNYQLGNITTQQLTDGRQRLYISTNSGNGSTMTTNHLSLYVDRDGNCSYAVGDKEAFRTAIDCPQNKELTNEDLNNVKTAGFYNAGGNNTCTNKPTNVTGAFGLLVIRTAQNVNYCKQYLFPITATAKPYFRNGSNGTWTAWRQISDISTTFYGTCSTAADSKNKEVTLSNSIGWQLTEGVVVGVKFTNSNTYANATDSPITLNVEGTGAKNIWYGSTHSGAGNTGTSTSIYGYAGRITYYMYDGTYWVWMGVSYLDGNTVPSAYCTTTGSTASKAATCTNYKLLANSYVLVTLTNDNSASSALTLNINTRGAKPIYINGTASSSSNYTLPAGTYLVFYDGTNYYFRTDGKITGKGIVDTDNREIKVFDFTNEYAQGQQMWTKYESFGTVLNAIENGGAFMRYHYSARGGYIADCMIPLSRISLGQSNDVLISGITTTYNSTNDEPDLIYVKWGSSEQYPTIKYKYLS